MKRFKKCHLEEYFQEIQDFPFRQGAKNLELEQYYTPPSIAAETFSIIFDVLTLHEAEGRISEG